MGGRAKPHQGPTQIIVPVGGVTMDAKWTINNYIQSFNGNGSTGGTVPGTRTVEYDATSTVPAGPTRTGYTFAGWYDTNAATGGTQLTTSYRQPAGDVTWYARWTRNNYTQSFNGNGNTGGTVPGTRTVEYDATSTVPAGPTRTGYTFAGWYDTNAATGGTQLTTSYRQPAGDVTWYARWTPNKYVLTLDFNGNGMSPRTQDVYYDSPYNINGAFPDPTWTGYVFDGGIQQQLVEQK
ncbi:InlB B-repeat-containing protein [Enterococcus termitis]